MLALRIKNKLDLHASRSLQRKRYAITKKTGNAIIVDGQLLINFCSNDYLHLTNHAKIKNSFIKGITKYGVGSGSSAQISGYSKAHQALEEKFAEFLNRDKAILFNSGYHANLGVITAFANRETAIIADKLCHASLIDGIILSRAKHYRYIHNDIVHAEKLLKANAKKDLLLISESIFSMEGDIAPINELTQIASQSNAMLVVDDAHGFGILGRNGKGIIEHFNLSQTDLPCLITPFGKALGSFGAIVSGSENLVEVLLQFSRTYRYSTALPPAICDATITALDVIKNETWRREKLSALISFFMKAANERELKLTSQAATPIKSILVGSNENAINMQKKLADNGFYVSCIRPPTVPDKSARIRISLNCEHTEAEILQLLDCIEKNYA